MSQFCFASVRLWWVLFVVPCFAVSFVVRKDMRSRGIWWGCERLPSVPCFLLSLSGDQPHSCMDLNLNMLLLTRQCRAHQSRLRRTSTVLKSHDHWCKRIQSNKHLAPNKQLFNCSCFRRGLTCATRALTFVVLLLSSSTFLLTLNFCDLSLCQLSSVSESLTRLLLGHDADKGSIIVISLMLLPLPSNCDNKGAVWGEGK